MQGVRGSNPLGSTIEGLLQLTSSSAPVNLLPRDFGVSSLVSDGDDLRDVDAIEVEQVDYALSEPLERAG